MATISKPELSLSSQQIDRAIVHARLERSRAFYAVIGGLFGGLGRLFGATGMNHGRPATS